LLDDNAGISKPNRREEAPVSGFPLETHAGITAGSVL
jgi:hypothetical protein